MAKAETVTLLTNIPLTLSALRYADYSQSEKAKAEGWAPQVKLTGTMDGRDVAVYLPGSCLNELVAQGIVDDTGNTTKWDTPEYKVLKTGPITILRTEDGKKKYTAINPDMGPAPQRAAPGANIRPLDETPRSTGKPPQKAPHAPKAESAGETNPPGDWAVLKATYAECTRIATETWLTAQRAFGADALGLSDVGLIAATATLFIEANKRGLKAFPPPLPPVPLTDMPRALAKSDEGMPWDEESREALNH